jgi:hypothetical protein
MATFEKRVTESANSGLSESGEVVNERTTRVESTAGGKNTAVNAVWFIYTVIAILLAARFAFRLFGANAANGFVNFIYSISKIFSAPFDTIFGVKTVVAGQTQSVFEPSILVAIAVYALVAWCIARLLTLNEKRAV